MKIVIGISGASGAIYGIRMLEVLRMIPEVETHLIISNAAKQAIKFETDWDPKDVAELADVVHKFGDIAAGPSSGSFPLDAMVILPCSMKTLAGIAYSLNENLLVRAADVTLKERRRLILAPRETPLHLGHLRTMVRIVEIGAILAPPMPAFYHRPSTVDDIINQTVNRILDLLDLHLPQDLFDRWEGAGPEFKIRTLPGS
jgi:4-hydroxy-3-polyprenylbenzoate decarboxylase